MKGFTAPNGRLGVYSPTYSPRFEAGPMARSPLWAAACDPNKYVVHNEWFHTYTASGAPYTLTQKTAGTAALSAVDAGTLVIDSASSTQHQGVNLQRVTAPFFCKTGGELFWTCRAKIVDTVGNANVFLGLNAVDTAILSSGVMDVVDSIGFVIETATNAFQLVAGKASTVAKAASGITPVEDTWFDLGVYVNGVGEISFFINDALIAQTAIVAATHIPVAAIFPSFVCESDGTDDPILHVGGYHVLQTR